MSAESEDTAKIEAAIDAARAKIEEGLQEYSSAIYGDSFIVTDWIISANTIDMAGNGETTRYLRPASNIASHAAKGLLQQAIDGINEDNLLQRIESER